MGRHHAVDLGSMNYRVFTGKRKGNKWAVENPILKCDHMSEVIHIQNWRAETEENLVS